jgi:hypothetical protein
VIDYAALTNDEIMAVLAKRPGATSTNDPVKSSFANVDGTTVPEAELLNPTGSSYPAEALEKAGKAVSSPPRKRGLDGLDPYCASPLCTGNDTCYYYPYCVTCLLFTLSAGACVA